MGKNKLPHSLLLSMAKILFLFTLLLLAIGCGNQSEPYDKNTEVAKGEPVFTALNQYWVIDNAGVLNRETISYCDSILESLKKKGIAETVIIIQNGVKNPSDWVTKYGRWLKLGKKGIAAEGGNRGLVWLIRPDADERLTPSVGRGLPKFTSQDYGEIMNKSIDYINFNNFDKGVKVLTEETAKKLQAIYGKP